MENFNDNAQTYNQSNPYSAPNCMHQICPHCGAVLKTDDTVCVKCGTPLLQYRQSVCRNCGNVLQQNQVFCPKCGQKTGSATTYRKKKSALPIIIGAAVAAVIIIAVVIILITGVGENDFNKMYSDIAYEVWCDIASDGSYLKIDTNPDDTDSDDLTWSDYENIMIPANDKIQEINNDLGFSSAVYEKMNSTTALMGVQTDSTDTYKVTWTYHPNNGLEVMYEFID